MGMMTNRSSGRNSHQPMAEINVTPMVDVILVLLIIFMVTSPLMVAGVTVDLPETTAAPMTGQDEPISVTVDASGDVYIQETKIKKTELTTKLQAIVGEKKDSRIFVRGDKTIDYGKVMEVVGLINAAGFNKVALLTEVSGR
ncbi:MAG: TolR [Rickettsiaceae bacterium]|jgi:biopolymer transport protein TolR|nr:TolR [Rickettsiaceae bacterium]